MPKELLLYGQIHAESSREFLKEYAETVAEGDDLVVRVNTPGGSPEYTFGLIAKFNEHAGNKRVKIDGKAYSMGLFFACYTPEVDALDTAEFLLHRAAYPEWVERDTEYFNDAMRGNLERINTSLRKAFEAKVDVALFEQLTGSKLKDVFSMQGRMDVTFDAKTAKKIGLIKNIITITPQKKAEIDSLMVKTAVNHFDIAAYVTEPIIPAAENKPDLPNQNKNKKMTLAELKANHADVYAQAVAEGVAMEKDRVEAVLVFNHLDPKGCKEIIESGKSLTQKQLAEFQLKAMSPEAIAAIQANAAPEVSTNAADNKEKTESQKKVEDFEKQARAELGLKN